MKYKRQLVTYKIALKSAGNTHSCSPKFQNLLQEYFTSHHQMRRNKEATGVFIKKFSIKLQEYFTSHHQMKRKQQAAGVFIKNFSIKRQENFTSHHQMRRNHWRMHCLVVSSCELVCLPFLLVLPSAPQTVFAEKILLAE